jgi:hypothetical protein
MSLTRQALRDVGRREAKRRVRELARGASRKDRRKLQRAISKVAWDRRDTDAIEYLKAKTEAAAGEVKAALDPERGGCGGYVEMRPEDLPADARVADE